MASMSASEVRQFSHWLMAQLRAFTAVKYAKELAAETKIRQIFHGFW
jgi:hypothetical protein